MEQKDHHINNNHDNWTFPNVGNHNSFIIPDNYMEQMQKEVLSKIATEPSFIGTFNIKVFKRVLVYAAAAIIALVISIQGLMNTSPQETKISMQISDSNSPSSVNQYALGFDAIPIEDFRLSHISTADAIAYFDDNTTRDLSQDEIIAAIITTIPDEVEDDNINGVNATVIEDYLLEDDIYAEEIISVLLANG